MLILTRHRLRNGIFGTLFFTLAAIGLIAAPILVPSAGRKAADTAAPSLSTLELISKADPTQGSATAGALMSPQLNQRTFSSDGRYVVFTSSAENLINGLSEDKITTNIYLHDRTTQTTTLVSHAAGSATTAANGDSFVPCLSGDGRFVVYWTFASNVVANQIDDGDSTPDVFIFDRTTGQNTLVSHIPGASSTAGDSNSYDPTISADGSFVSFTSAASNLVSGQTDGGASSNIFVWYRVSDTLALVTHSSANSSTTADGSSFNSVLSNDGSFVAFLSNSSNLVSGQTQSARRYEIFLWDRNTNQAVLVSHSASSITTATNGASYDPVLNADASYIAFYSAGTDLISNQVDANQNFDIFIFERATGTNTLVSHTAGSTSTTGSMAALYPAVSADGRFVVYQSAAPDLIAGDLNNAEDIFLWDRTTNANALVSRSATSLVSESANAKSFGGKISADASTITFTSNASDLLASQTASGKGDVFFFDRSNSTLHLISHVPGSASQGGNDYSFLPLVNADGTFVAFNTLGNDVVPNDNNGSGDVIVYDRAANANTAASARAANLSTISANGHSGGQRSSADGRFVVFVSEAVNLVPDQADGNNVNDIFVRDRQANTTTLVSHAAGLPAKAGDAVSDSPVISADGRWIAYASKASDLVEGATDVTGGADVFLYDRVNDTTVLVSHSFAAANFGASDISFSPAMSSDGRFVAYTSYAVDLVAGESDSNNDTDVFVFDRTTGTNALVSHDSGAPSVTGLGYSFAPVVSPDGNFIAYYSAATDLVPNQTNAGNSVQHAFLYDRVANSNAMIDHQPGDAVTSGDGNAGSTEPLDPPVFSGDGLWIAYASGSTNLVSGQTDTNADYDIFLFDRSTGTNLLASHRPGSLTTAGDDISYNPSLSANGRFLSYRSAATDLVPGQVDTNTFQDVFLFDRDTGTNVLVSHTFASSTTAGDGLSGESPRYGYQSVSPDGRFVAFWSSSTDLVLDYIDSNGINGDLFLFDRVSGENTLISHDLGATATGGNNGSGDSQHIGGPVWSSDGFSLFFASRASNVIADDFNNREDVLALSIGGTTPTPTPTATPTATATATATPTSTATATPTATATATPTSTATATPTATATATPTPTATATPTATPSASPSSAKMLNISTRVPVRTGDQVGIGGFILRGTAPKRVVIRAIGPSLRANGSSLPGRLEDPTLELRASDGSLLAANDNWRSSQETEITSTGLAPTDERESAIVKILTPGNYTAIIRGAGGTTGIGVVEVYDVESASLSDLGNISTRGFVDTGDNVIIGGFIVRGDSSQKVLLRAIGPELTASGVPNVLQDSVMELRDENGGLLMANDNWRETQQTEIEATGIPPHDDRESAIVRTLGSGNYTAIIRGKGDATGVALMEAYNLGKP
jgi:hypothetical protein